MDRENGIIGLQGPSLGGRLDEYREGREVQTYHYISPLQTGKDALLVNDQSQDGATGDDPMADAAITLGMRAAGIVGDRSD